MVLSTAVAGELKRSLQISLGNNINFAAYAQKDAVALACSRV